MGAPSAERSSIVGEEAHIISGKPNGPRHDPAFPKEQIDSFENLLLLCAVHHKHVDDQPETLTATILRDLKSNHESWVTRALVAAVAEMKDESPDVDAFSRTKAMMPQLIAEMRSDLAELPFVREFMLLSKRWGFWDDPRNPIFKYFFEDHENLQGKIHVLENCGFIVDVTTGTTRRYRILEHFTNLLSVSSRAAMLNGVQDGR